MRRPLVLGLALFFFAAVGAALFFVPAVAQLFVAVHEVDEHHARRSEPGVPGERAEPAPLPVRVVSFNVWGLPLAQAPELEARLAKMPAALRALAPDVICLQETWTEGVRKALVDGLAPEWKPAAARGGGLLLLSRWPTSDATFTPYPVPPGLAFVERLAGKGVLAVTVATPAGPLRVLDTHCTAFDRASRNVQIKHLVTTLLPHETDLPMVLAGDFNMSPLDSGPGGVSVLDPAYASITAFGFEDALAPTRLPDGTWAERELGTFGGWPRPGTEDEAKARSFVVDHVFVRGRSLRLLSARVELWTRATALSDHNLLCADLALSR